MGITFKEFAWLVEPDRINKNFEFGGVAGCPGDVIDSEIKPSACKGSGEKECTECWNCKIPYPVIAEAVRDTLSLAGFNIKKGSKFKVCEVDIGAKTNFTLCIFDFENDVKRYVCANDFKIYIQKEEEKVSKFKVGDKVRVKKFKTRPERWNSNGYMDKYAGKIVTISDVFKNHELYICEDNKKWMWDESDFTAAEFTKNDLKDGMMVEQRDGSRWLWLYGELRGIGVWRSVTQEDLTGQNQDLDIVKIGYPEIDNAILGRGELEFILESDFAVILWERQEVKEISSEEAFAVLKEHYGCDVKIKE